MEFSKSALFNQGTRYCQLSCDMSRALRLRKEHNQELRKLHREGRKDSVMYIRLSEFRS